MRLHRVLLLHAAVSAAAGAAATVAAAEPAAEPAAADPTALSAAAVAAAAEPAAVAAVAPRRVPRGVRLPQYEVLPSGGGLRRVLFVLVRHEMLRRDVSRVTETPTAHRPALARSAHPRSLSHYPRANETE